MWEEEFDKEFDVENGRDFCDLCGHDHTTGMGEYGNRIKTFISNNFIEKQHLKEALERKKKYSGKHNAEHSWIQNGFCKGCDARLTSEQLEEEFGYNQALDDILKLIDLWK